MARDGMLCQVIISQHNVENKRDIPRTDNENILSLSSSVSYIIAIEAEITKPKEYPAKWPKIFTW
jgi:hypothetical protein